MPIDFRSSFLEWETIEGSIGKFKIEAALITNKEAYVLGSEVLACEVYGQKDLFREPVYKFQALFSEHNQLTLRTFVETQVRNDTVIQVSPVFKKVTSKLNEIGSYNILSDYQAILGSYDENQSFQAIININNVELQFPIKHINLHRSEKNFQVETGPVIVNDTDGLTRAFVAFNSLDRIEFMIETGRDNKRTYNKRVSIETNIQLIGL